MALPEIVDIGSLGRIIQALQDSLKEHARQGADEQTALDSQFIAIGEECGEALGAYRRWRGFARRSGPASDVYEELADVIIVAMVGILHFNEIADDDFDVDPSEIITTVLARKLNKIFSRGFVNKDDPKPDGHDPDPDNPGFRRDGYRLPLICGHQGRDPYAEREHAMVCIDYQQKHRELYAQDTTEEPPTRAAYSPGGRLFPDGEPSAPEPAWTNPVDWDRVKISHTDYTAAHRKWLRKHNALDAVAAIDPEDNPNGVYKRESDGRWTFLGQSDAVDWEAIQASQDGIVIALGRTIRDRRQM